MLSVMLEALITTKDGQIMLEGAPLQILATELTPALYAPGQWSDQISSAKNAGFNAICVQIIWRQHVTASDGLDFSSAQNNIATFVGMCAAQGMRVIIRAGPFNHGDATLGGWPFNVLKTAIWPMRTSVNLNYRLAYEKYLNALLDTLQPYFVNNDGPIMLWQIEDHYSSWNHQDPKYIDQIQGLVQEAGYRGLFLTADSPSKLDNLSFAPERVLGLDLFEYNEAAFETVEALYPGAVVMASRLLHERPVYWGSNPKIYDCAFVTKTLAAYLKSGRSLIFTPLAEGSYFGTMAGASLVEGQFRKHITRHQYSAPITETGGQGICYREIKMVLSGSSHQEDQGMIEETRSQQIPLIALKRIGGLFDQQYDVIQAKEAIDLQSLASEAEFAIYTIILPAGEEAVLACQHVQDHAVFYVGGQYLASFERRQTDALELVIPSLRIATKLEIFVAVAGRLEYYDAVPEDKKGVYGLITLNGEQLLDWQIRFISADTLMQNLQFADREPQRQGGVFQGSFWANSSKATFIDISGYRRGFVSINGHSIGNFYPFGPQYRLYCPGEWIKAGTNLITIVDIEQQIGVRLTGFELAEGCPEKQHLEDGFCRDTL